MDLLTAFTLASCGACLFTLAKEKNRKYKILGRLMFVLSFISALTFFLKK